MDISQLTQEDEGEWNKFVGRTPESTFYHQIGWKNVVERTYGHKPIYLVAKEGDDIRGVLPLFLLKSRFFGCRLISIPFGAYGGVCTEDEATADALIKEAKRITKDTDAKYLELRHRDYYNEGLETNRQYYTLILELNKDTEIISRNLRKSMRRYIRKAEESNLKVSMNSEIKNFYSVYAHNMRDLGSPTHDYRFFKNLAAEFPKEVRIAAVFYKDKPIAAILLLYYKKTVVYGWGSSLNEYSSLYPNYLLFWETIKQSCRDGFDFFDFGRSQKNSGTFSFKEGWGAKPHQLYYQYYLNKIKNIPDTSSTNPKRKSFAKIWRRLPLALTNRFGPILRKNVA